MANIKNLKETLDFALTLGMSVDEAIQDGFSALDLVSILPAFVKAPAALEDINQVVIEIEDLDEAEKTELNEFIEKFDLKSDRTEEIVEQSLFLAVEILRLILMLREAKKEE